MVGMLSAMAFCVISTYFRLSCPVNFRKVLLGGYKS